MLLDYMHTPLILDNGGTLMQNLLKQKLIITKLANHKI